ncbi:39S ribosomal protein L28, mitochondrial [Octopus bimaculoides]|uniref:Large ribosomal subunit protein bL28m n=1 Tax=Octopus bimaculoides TaxID=37653 RepID=A0A0L8GTZ4_OCTBM|nr:39S ribosomal protein L28, mitochondrial [Octopus bimaculoides]|eukprot:XP_014778137.1 PREDICTED: 39S ribosomal protein L28, mitochondrial-like [Octopus bimaculoides]
MIRYRKFFRWSKEIDTLLPECYKRWCQEFNAKEPTPVHWKPAEEYISNPKINGKKLKVVNNYPLPVIYPKQSDAGLWGGEGLVYGLRKKRRTSTRTPFLWRPNLEKRALYSEILEKWLEITVTQRTLMMIDEVYGFDNYILKTHAVDLNSNLGLRLKRQMLLALARRSFAKDNLQKQEEIYQRYKEFVISEEEAEWVGLSVRDALRKANALRIAENPIVPLKELYTKELIEKLKTTTLEEPSSEPPQSSLLSKLNPFKTDT